MLGASAEPEEGASVSCVAPPVGAPKATDFFNLAVWTPAVAPAAAAKAPATAPTTEATDDNEDEGEEEEGMAAESATACDTDAPAVEEEEFTPMHFPWPPTDPSVSFSA